ncbi:hypothetical protein GGS20DRAFT_43728 [Poronia punctata]|nr:hypothetical protein GGS20DRAFT_43728 [Poronia punctata]
MAGNSPTRRSSRARITQSQSQVSSTASSSSGRVERTTRAFTKTGSPQKSTGSGSLSSEPPEDSTTTTEDTVHRRRSMRGKDDDREKHSKPESTDMAAANDEIQEDDESVRCICGHDEYPGPPPFDEDSKHGVKDAIDHDRIFAIEITDDLAGFFVQCEICNTWQHGACVGFTTEESNPDDVEYFCEQCRKDLHKIYTASNGQKYSIFLPIHRPSPNASRATSATKEDARSPKSGSGKPSRASAAAQSASKRRSTMNSRDAAYDEEEQLRRAIEASKEETVSEDADVANRRPKRGREESEEKVESVKRQRTNSKSPSPVPEKPSSTTLDESDDELGLRNGSSKRSRNAVRTQRERAEREERREEQERKRAEAASKRKGRAERRRADESDPSEELPLATRSAANRSTESVQPSERPATAVQPPAETPPVSAAPVTTTTTAAAATTTTTTTTPATTSTTTPATITTKKKTAQSRKKGRNQYTKDRDNDHEDSPARNMPRDASRNEEGGTSNPKTAHEGTAKHGKGKGGMSSRVTMSDMKRRVNGILEFITRKQVELAGDSSAETGSTPSQTGTDDGSRSTPKINGEGGQGRLETPTAHDLTMLGLTDPTAVFKDLSCVEMMDVLTRDLLKWQQEFVQ